MIQEIINLVKQLPEDDKKELLTYIKGQYTIEERKGMLRDDIKDRIFELIKLHFATGNFTVKEEYSFKDLYIDSTVLAALCEIIENDFEIEPIEFSRAMEWQRVKDIIDTVDDILICAEETKS